ncbi:MAG: serine/threonine-protein kinase [Solirubrobacteraceae bacterium]
MEARGSQFETGSILAGYRIDELISRGGMGVVYRATNVALNRIYALKVLAPELADDDQFRDRFRREMRIAASLHHPNVVGIHYADEYQGLLFLVMDFISGTDLRELLRKSGSLDPSRASDMLAQLASALDAAHRRGLVHRDVKPANILIAVTEGEERTYLTDFGLAKRFDTQSSIAGLTKTGVVVGTVDYMSPEQITGSPTDARTDIYALGCVFFQMLTGQAPYERDNSVATLFAHVHEPPPSLEAPLDELYPTFGAVIEKAMAKDPDDRYLSAGDFARDAAAALRGSRYTGPQTVVATGEARPSLGEEDATEPPILSSAPTRPAREAPTAHAETKPAAPAEPAGPTIPSGGAPARSGGGLRKYRWLALAGVVVACGAIAAVIALSSSGSSGPPGPRFSTLVRAVPTNRVTGTGTATVQVNGNVATVTVDTVGLIGAAHLMHIHGSSGNCPSASAARLYKGHLAIGAAEGDKVYGGVVTSLTDTGSTSPAVHQSYPLFPAVGNIRYKRTIQLAPGVSNIINEGLAVIVVHGIDYQHNGVYDDFLGTTSPTSTDTVEQAAPALCGPLVPTQTASVGQHSQGVIYTAALHTYGGTTPGESFSLLCHIGPVPPTTPQPAAARLQSGSAA